MNSLLTTIFTLHFFNDGIRTAIITLLPFISKEFHLTFSQIGLIGASQGLVSMLLAVPMGIITSKINGIKLLFMAIIFYSLCVFALGFAANFFILFLLFYLAAIAFAPFHIISQSATARESTKNNLGRLLGTFATVGDSGRIAIPAAALFITNLIGWRDTFITIAISGVIIFFLLLWLLRDKKHILQQKNEISVEENSIDWLKQMYSIFRQKKLLYITIAGLLDGIGGASIYLYLPFLLLAKGVPHTLLSLYVGIYFAGSLLGKKYLGQAVDTYGSLKIFIAAELLMSVFLLSLAFLPNNFLLLFVTLILGLFTRGTSPVIMTLYSSVSHVAHYEKVYTISEIFLGGAAVLSPLLLGKVADIFSITTVFYLSATLAICAAVPILLYEKIKN